MRLMRESLPDLEFPRATQAKVDFAVVSVRTVCVCVWVDFVLKCVSGTETPVSCHYGGEGHRCGVCNIFFEENHSGMLANVSDS